MSQNNMIRWIETAEARQFVTIATECRPVATETHRLHLGASVIKMPVSLAMIGNQAIAYMRHPLFSKRP